MFAQRNCPTTRQKSSGKGYNNEMERAVAVYFFHATKHKRKKVLQRSKSNCVRGKEMGGRFGRGDLGPLFVDAPSGSSVSEQAKICRGDRKEQGAMTHFSRVKLSAMQPTMSEREGWSHVANNVGQKREAIGCLLDGQLV